jgi:predicted GIY-YIG superfamily endonuclease
LTYIYFFNQLASDLYKIGITNSITRRLREVQNGNAEPITCRYYIEAENRFDARETEKELHRLLSGVRKVGEWFRLGGEDMGLVEQIWDIREWEN